MPAAVRVGPPPVFFVSGRRGRKRLKVTGASADLTLGLEFLKFYTWGIGII